MSKSPDAFRTISEVADDLELPQHVLRFWETRFSQIKPLKRGGGRRHYRPDDVDLLKGIKFFLYEEGYTIRGVQKILREQGLRHLVDIGRGGEAMALHEEAHMDDDGLEASDAPRAEPGKKRKKAKAPLSVVEELEATDEGFGDLFPMRPKAIPLHLSRAEVSLLHSTLSELLECKRRLDALRI